MLAWAPGAGATRHLVAVLAFLATGSAALSYVRTAEAAEPTSASAAASAEEHYQRAKELYSHGSYREALSELEAARALDPNAKELVFNLGVVSEKLGRFDDALRYFRSYAQMEGLTLQEKQRADSFIKRLEGAKKEVVPPQTGTTTQPPQSPPPKKEEPPPNGRVDAATIAVGAVAVAGVAVGTVFGVKALSDRPKDFRTGRDGSYSDFVDKNNTANREALVADVGFVVGAAAALATAYLYFARPRVASRAPTTGATVSVAPVATQNGGAFVVRGVF